MRKTQVRRAVRIRRIVVVALPIALAVLAIGAVAGPYIYIHFIERDPPKELAFETASSTTASTTANSTTTAGESSPPIGDEGAWTVAAGSTVGYRVSETIMGQASTAVGRTTAVTGTLSIAGISVRSADFTVDVTKIASDNDRRDGSVAEVMQTSAFPTAKFTLTKPIALGGIPPDLQQITVPVTGTLTLHGETSPVTFDLKARRNGSKIEVNGSIPITLSNYGIANPSIAGAITVGDHGKLEFLLVFARS